MPTNDTPDTKSIVEEAMVEVETKSETPVVSTEATPTEESKEEVFAEKGDLTGKTEEELEEIYKNWQRAYTEKRQKESQRIKDLEVKLEKLSKSQSLPKNTTVEERAAMAQDAVDLGQMTVSQYTEYMKSLAVETAREEFKTIRAEEKENQLAEKALEEFQNADERLNEFSPDHDEDFRLEVQRELAERLDDHLEEFGSYKGFDAKTLTREIVDRRDKKMDEIIKKRTLNSTQAAKMREAKARKSEVRGTTSGGQPIGGNSIRSILSDAADSIG